MSYRSKAYTIVEYLSKESIFGIVNKCEKKQTKEIVAIKNFVCGSRDVEQTFEREIAKLHVSERTLAFWQSTGNIFVMIYLFIYLFDSNLFN